MAVAEVDYLAVTLEMTDGQVTGTRRFTPWGEVLAQSGQSDLTSGYLGGMLDAATGLIYVGNGQYYDPETGRFLTRNVNPMQTNPYVPWSSDPAGAILALWTTSAWWN